MIKLVGFDLDNTLFSQRDFEFPVFEIIAETVAEEYKVEKSVYFDNLVNGFETKVQSKLFDYAIRKTMNEVPESWESFVVKILVPIYRNYEPAKPLIARALGLRLLRLCKKLELSTALLTNGRMESQSTKLDSLGISQLFDLILISDDFNPPLRKPNTGMFEKMLRHFNVKALQAIYIGDDDKIDGSCEEIGIKFMNIELFSRGVSEIIISEISDVSAFEDLLHSLNVNVESQNKSSGGK